MTTKNVYFFKVVIQDTEQNREVPVNTIKGLFDAIFEEHGQNGALMLSRDRTEPIMLDVIENNDEYVFAKLNRKRPNNSMQRRNYDNFRTSDVLGPDEIGNNGVELFTYCILGYSHGILSIVNAKGAPNEGALARIFTMYNNRYSLQTDSVPNQDLIAELMAGEAPEINRIQVDIARPDAQILEQLFGFNDNELLNAVQANTTNIIFDVKPTFRGSLCDDINLIARLVNCFRRGRGHYNSVILSGKPETGMRQRRYDLYEEYFKYPISVSEYRQEDGQKVEIDKYEILEDYRDSMMDIYNNYKDVILAVCDR